jgi:hypothetical protein
MSEMPLSLRLRRPTAMKAPIDLDILSDIPQLTLDLSG